MGDDRFLSYFFKFYYGFTSFCVMAKWTAILVLKKVQYFIGNWGGFLAFAFVHQKSSRILCSTVAGIFITNLQLRRVGVR